MTKTLDDYMNDPDILGEPMALREVHAIRLKIHDEIKDMTTAEKSAYYRERIARLRTMESAQIHNGIVES